MNQFTGKIFWITGASSGIGEALVYKLTELGAIVIASSNKIEDLKLVKEKCGESGEHVHIAAFDLSETDGIRQLVDSFISQFGRIDFLVNLGGVSQRATIEETPLWLDRKIMEINYFGTIALTKAILPYMIRQKAGHILATSSMSGRFGFPLRSAYSASKQALHGFFETLHIENQKYNIRASVIIPGRVRTNISRGALTATGEEHGRMDRGQAGGISPDKAARTILKGIKRNKREILVGGSELIMLHVRKYLPAIFFNIAGKIKSQ